MYCSRCGTQLVAGARFCNACGQAVDVSSALSAGPPTALAAPTALPPRPYAGFWLRLVAYIIDGLVLSVGLALPIALFVILSGVGRAIAAHPQDFTPDQISPAFVALILFVVLVVTGGTWLYYALLESSHWQGTLGKMALGLVVTDMKGRPISFARASGRFFGKFITGLIPFFIGYLMAGFTARKQALHDMMAGCLVLRKL